MIVTFSDLETTGKLKPDHRIIEASFRVCKLETQEEITNHLFRFNPQRNIDAKAQAVHGISIDELKGEPLFKDKIPELKAIIENSDIMVFHNGEKFDWPYLQMEFKTNGETLPETPVFDTMVHGTFATELGKAPKLSELCWSLDVDYSETLAHKGDYDTAVLRDAFFNAIRYGWFQI